MKVYGFVGSALAGKTTVITDVSKELRDMGYNVKVVGESFRDVLKKYGKKLDEVRKEPTLYARIEAEAMNEHICKVKACVSARADVVLIDRLLVDYFLYSVEYLRFDLWVELVRKYCDMAVQELFMVDAIFLCEPVYALEWDDGVRSMDDVKNQWVHFELLKRWLVNGRTIIVRGGRDERKRTVLGKILKDLGQL